MKQIIKFFKEEDGATVPEYALMVALIAAVVVGAVTVLGNNSSSVLGFAAGEIGGS